jgi:hypothetical protein
MEKNSIVLLFQAAIRQIKFQITSIKFGACHLLFSILEFGALAQIMVSAN